ncbi:MAG TPA: molybdenum cofactor biosynthesis protein MoaE [Gemmatimonadaceae bacterium]|jgi:molybdopterin synthase catalytic subunit
MYSSIVDHPIDVAAIIERVGRAANGAAVLFLGNVREVNEGLEVTGIEYTAYRSMAERELASIVEEAAAVGDTNDVAVEHRLGELVVGECSVAVAVGHPHRGRAFETARYVVEELKRRVPIWKREHYVDGTREWVSAATSKPETQLVDIGDER